MNLRRAVTFCAIGLLAAFLHGSGAATPIASGSPGPANVARGWWAGALDLLRRGEYDVTWQDGTGTGDLPAAWQSPNRAQGLRAYYTRDHTRIVPRDGSSPDWRWDIAVTGYGRRDALRAALAADPVVADNRISFDRGDLTEWFVNEPEGIQQGFTFVRPGPGLGAVGGTPLAVEIAVDGGVLVHAPEANGAIEIATASRADVARYGPLEARDARGRVLDATLGLVERLVGNSQGSPAERRLRLTVDTRAATFPVTLTARITGHASSSASDWIVAGGQAETQFGVAVGTAGDINHDGFADVIIGAWRYDAGQVDEGAAFAFLGASSGLARTPAWHAEGDQAGAHFGKALGMAGDVNGDGIDDFVVGAPGFDSPSADQGRAFLYVGAASELDTKPRWVHSGDHGGDTFGASLGTAGDVDGDGYTDVIVGAPGDDQIGTTLTPDVGCASVFEGTTTGLNSQPAWRTCGSQPLEQLGVAVGTAGDVNADHFDDVVVGAWAYDGQFTDEGRVLVFHGAQAGLGTTANWTQAGGQAGARFGVSVASAGDVNGDGKDDLVAGANHYAHGQADEGAAAAFRGSATGLVAPPMWLMEGNQPGAQFGFAVAGAGDVDGDGYDDVIVGAPYYDGGQVDEGRAYGYRGSSSGLLGIATWTSESDQAQAGLGYAVAAAGDVDGDDKTELVVGAPGYDGTLTNEGRAYVYDPPAPPPPPETPTATATATQTATPTMTRTATATATPTATRTSSPSPTASRTVTASPTATGTATTGPTATASPTATGTAITGPTATHTPTATGTAITGPTATHTPTATGTATTGPTASPTPSSTATNTTSPPPGSAPVISLLPASGSAGIPVRVLGSGLLAEHSVSVYWDVEVPGRELVKTLSGADRSLDVTITVPTGPTASTGHHQVLVVVASGAGPTRLSAGFTVTYAPEVQVEPALGPVGTTLDVTVRLRSTSGAIQIEWDGRPILGPASLGSSSTWRGTVRVPRSTAGSHEIAASHLVLGRVIGRSAQTFAVLPGESATPARPPTPLPLVIHRPQAANGLQPIDVSGSADPGETIHAGLAGEWSSSLGGRTYRALTVLDRVQAGADGHFEAQIPGGAAFNQSDQVAVGAVAGAQLAQETIPYVPNSYDFSGRVTIPIVSTNNILLREDPAVGATVTIVSGPAGWAGSAVTDSDGRYQMWLRRASGAARLAQIDPPSYLPRPEIQIPLRISAYLNTKDADGNLVDRRWSRAYDVHVSEEAQIVNLRLDERVSGPPAIEGITSSLDYLDDPERMGTFLAFKPSDHPEAYTHGVPPEPDVPSDIATTVQAMEDRTLDWVEINDNIDDICQFDTPTTATVDCRQKMGKYTGGTRNVETVTAEDSDGLQSSREAEIATRDASHWYATWLGCREIEWHAPDAANPVARYTLNACFPAWNGEALLRYGWENDLGPLGTLESEISADVELTEAYTMDDKWTGSAEARAKVKLLGFDLLDESEPLEVEYDPRQGDGFQAIRWHQRLWQDTLGPYTVFQYGYGIPEVAYIGIKLDFGLTGELWADLAAERSQDFDGLLPGLGLSFCLTPAVEPFVDLGVQVDLLVIGSGGADLQPSVYVSWPLCYAIDGDQPGFYMDDPCFGFRLRLRVWAEVDLWFWSDSWTVYDENLVDVQSPAGCRPSAAVHVNQAPDRPHGALSVPRIASDGSGHAMAVWVHNEDPNGSAPKVYYRYWDGGAWGDDLRLTQDDRNVSAPAVTFLRPGRAMAAWVQNELARDDARATDLKHILPYQELYYSLWDGTAWQSPGRLTNDLAADGRVALAADPNSERVMAVWVTDLDGNPATAVDMEIRSAVWDGTKWSTPISVAAGATGMENEPAVAYDRTGRAVAVWTRDADADSSDAGDRQLVLATWDGDTWSEPAAPQTLPVGVAMPDIAIGDNNRALLVFTVVDDPKATVGNRQMLWYARELPNDWEVGAIGQGVRAEDPSIAIDNGTARVLFRHIGEPLGQDADGEIGVSSASLDRAPLSWSPVGNLTSGGGRNWFVDGVYDAAAEAALLVHVRQDKVPPGTGIGTSGGAQAPDNPTGIIASNGFANQADLAVLDLVFSDDHPLGAPTVLTATIRNGGLAAAGPFSVRFVLDDPETGPTIAQMPVPGLQSQETRAVAAIWQSTPGEHDIYAVADADAAVPETDEENNRAARAIGSPPVPRNLRAQALPGLDRVLLTWEPGGDLAEVAGFRVYRATRPGGPYDLVALAMDQLYEDWQGIRAGLTYHYVLTAYDTSGAESRPSSEVAVAVPRIAIYLPSLAQSGQSGSTAQEAAAGLARRPDE